MIWLIAGLVLLVVGGEALVRGASALARSFRVSPLVKALTWMRYQSADDRVMVTQLPTSDWRDEHWVSHDQSSSNTWREQFLSTARDYRSIRFHPIKTFHGDDRIRGSGLTNALSSSNLSKTSGTHSLDAYHG